MVDVPVPGAARDPGVRGRIVAPVLGREIDPRGQAVSDVGKTLSFIGGKFAEAKKKRERAEDDVTLASYDLETSKDIAEAERELLSRSNDDNFVEIADQTINDRLAQREADFNARGFSLSDEGKRRLALRQLELREAAVGRAAAKFSNQRVSFLVDKAQNNIRVRQQQTLEDGDVDSALQGVEADVESVRSAVSPEQARALREEGDRGVVEAGVNHHLARNNPAAARAIMRGRVTGVPGRKAGTVVPQIFAAAEQEGVDPLVLTAIGRAESRLKPEAKNPNSTAAGVFQFTSGTGTKFGLATDARNSSVAAQSRAAARLTASNTADLKRALGGEPSPGEIYLAHVLGSPRAIKVLSADPDAPLKDLLPKGVLDANPQFRDMTAARIAAWATNKMQTHMESAISEGQVEGRNVGARQALLPIKTAVKLNKEIAEQEKKMDRARLVLSGAQPADPANQDDRKIVDEAAQTIKLSQHIANQDERASTLLTNIVDRYHIVPDSVAGQLRGMAVNGTPEERVFALQATAQMLRQVPTAMDAGEKVKDLRNDARAFETYVLDVGLNPEDALARIDRTKTDEFRKDKDVRETAAKEEAKKLTKGTLTDVFDTPFTFEPELGGSDRRGDRILEAFRQNFTEHFVSGPAAGNSAAARALAIKDLQKSFGVSELAGAKRLMRHPPELHYPSVGGSREYFTEQLQAAVNEAASIPKRTKEGRTVVRNADGSFSTERTETVTDERINNRRPTNIPTIFGGRQISQEEAIRRVVEAGGKDPETGRKLPAFASIPAAEKAAAKRSEAIGKELEGRRRQTSLSDIFIEGTPQTDADIRAGRAPGYGVVWRNENGVLESVPGTVFRADVDAARKEHEARLKRQKKLSQAQDIQRQAQGVAAEEFGFVETEGAVDTPEDRERRRKLEEAVQLAFDELGFAVGDPTENVKLADVL